MDFSAAKPVSENPALAALQSRTWRQVPHYPARGQCHVGYFKARAEMTGATINLDERSLAPVRSRPDVGR